MVCAAVPPDEVRDILLSYNCSTFLGSVLVCAFVHDLFRQEYLKPWVHFTF
jgi:hypothetical protein